MDCDLAEEHFIPFVIGVSDSAEKEMMRAHVDSCADCRQRIQDEGETIARLAFAVTQLQAPAHLKDRLLTRIEEVDGPVVQKSNTSKLALVSMSLVSLPTAGAVVSVLLFGIFLGGTWFNGRSDETSVGNGEIVGQLENVINGNRVLNDSILDKADLRPGVGDVIGRQRRQSYDTLRVSAAPGATVNMLRGTGPGERARGMLMVSRSGSHALLLALDLRPLSPDEVYQVWLLKDGRRYSGGYFTVDSSGYGQTLIFPYASIADFEGIGITIEPLGGGSGPTGTSVLKGDL